MEYLESVEAIGLTRLFGSTPALRGVSARFVPGQLSILSGPNGAGKSTLLALLGTRLRPTRGRIEYQGPGGPLELREVRRQLGWVSHESLCYGELSGRKNVELILALNGLPLSDYARVADQVGLGAFADRPVQTLSRGQRQRVALARALCHRPRLLLLDEPWTGLDRDSARLLDELTLAQARSGSIVIVVSHEADILQRLGGRELRLNAGQLASGRPVD